MEESQKVVSSDYLKRTCRLEKITVELERIKATNEQLLKEGKARETEMTRLQSTILQEKSETNKLHNKLKIFEGQLRAEQSARNTVIKELYDKTQDLFRVQAASSDMAQQKKPQNIALQDLHILKTQSAQELHESKAVVENQQAENKRLQEVAQDKQTKAIVLQHQVAKQAKDLKEMHERLESKEDEVELLSKPPDSQPVPPQTSPI
ncbi:uncharacterized protein LOC131860229 [Cryptomeria japonica]|uniref:uncharacterized protein LOC131860229 n=1 Tax=Cryptomeria japonica TaxID=3369 RepID=UPI0027DA7058|nr:uncharacterized protein LOC131860229 [Cryptomeria japonica]